MIINDMMLSCTAEQVLNDLSKELSNNDLQLFRITKNSGKNIQTICPFHSGGMEKKPSFGIHKENGACHCFTCGWGGSLEDLISALFNKEDYGVFGLNWLKRNYYLNSFNVRNGFKVDLQRQKVDTRKNVEIVNEQELDKYRYTHPYMYKRGLTDELIERFDIGFDKETNCITVPVYNLKGECVFIARRSTIKKYFHYPKEVEKPVYLANVINSGNYDYCVIVESFFNALTLWKYNIPAVALLGLGTPSQVQILKALPVRKYILGLDPDIRGYNAMDKLRKELKDYKLVSQYKYLDGRDINDLDEEVFQLEEIF